MPIIQCKNLQKSYPPLDLLTNITFSVEVGERIGLVGRNGCGKTTLLSLLCRATDPDAGELMIPKTGIGYLPQNPASVMDTEGFSDMAFYYAARLGLDYEAFDRMDEASGGERTKAALSLLFAQDPTVLLLDEPTNHMDINGIRALSELLREFTGTAIVVSHDRYFLDLTVDRIIEIDAGCAVSYAGNYSYYKEEKERLYKDQLHRYESERKEQRRIEDAIKKTREWAQKGHRDSTKPPSGTPKMGYKEKERVKAKKLDSSAQSRIKRLEKRKASGEEKPIEDRKVRFSISGEAQSGKRILEVRDLSMAFGERCLFRESSFYVHRGEHVAVFGENGCGKSTLFSILLGDADPVSGDVWISPGRTPHYLPQSTDLFDGESETGLSYLQRQVGVMDGAKRSILHQMGIETRHLSIPLMNLSYGEKMKIRLAEPILRQTEFLILDEPTHHLDLPTREALEDTLKEYGGTLLVVSHDIYFLQKVCDKVLLFEEGHIRRMEQSFAELFPHE